MNVNNHTKNSSPKVALVTGAAGTLGSAISQKLADRDYYVLMTDVDRNSISNIDAKEGRYHQENLDVTKPTDWQSARDWIHGKFGYVDCLVNCAGVVAVGEFEKTPWEDHRRVIEVNLAGTALGCQTMMELLCQPERSSHLINVASYFGFVSPPWSASYNAAKAGVVSLSETLAAEWKSKNVNVSVVCPAFFPSSLFPLHQHPNTDPAIHAAMQRMVEQSRTTADQVANTAIDLLDDPRFLTILPAEAKRAWRMKRWFPEWFRRHISARSFALRAKMQAQIDATGSNLATGESTRRND